MVYYTQPRSISIISKIYQYNNQYNYEGLLARWDYMAASLLLNGGGGGNGDISDGGFEISEIKDDNQQSEESDKFDESYESNDPFTKEQRKTINSSIVTVTKTKRENEEAKINNNTNGYNIACDAMLAKLSTDIQKIKSTL